jgi:hypothetical protein
MVTVKAGMMRNVIMEKCGRPEWRSEKLTNLVATFKQLGGSGTPIQHDQMYNATTCIEFHRLLLATLLAYGHTLCALMVPGNRKQKYLQVWFCGGLLREIASSLMLRQHLDACEPWLFIPINDSDKKHIQTYQDYTGFLKTERDAVSLMLMMRVAVRMGTMREWIWMDQRP